MLLSNKAVYSGKGTPMVSKQGISTICNYNCFKQNLTDLEMRKTGLKPTFSQDEIDRITEKRDVFKNVESTIKETMNMGSSAIVQEIRESIRANKQEKEMSFIMKNASNAIKVIKQAQQEKVQEDIQNGVRDETEGIDYLTNLVKSIKDKGVQTRMEDK